MSVEGNDPESPSFYNGIRFWGKGHIGSLSLEKFIAEGFWSLSGPKYLRLHLRHINEGRFLCRGCDSASGPLLYECVASHVVSMEVSVYYQLYLPALLFGKAQYLSSAGGVVAAVDKDGLSLFYIGPYVDRPACDPRISFYIIEFH